MAKLQPFRSRLATFAIVFALAFSLTFLITNQAPRAEAQTTQLASAEAPHNLHGSTAGRNARIRVIDGDTLEDTRDDITYRLVNIDTPETGSRARCSAERTLGDRATGAART